MLRDRHVVFWESQNWPMSAEFVSWKKTPRWSYPAVSVQLVAASLESGWIILFMLVVVFDSDVEVGPEGEVDVDVEAEVEEVRCC